jgi:hypothetical protein
MTLSPLQAAQDVLDRAEALLAAADQVSVPLVSEDMCRFALAQGVAALDTYLHWAIADVPLKKMPTALARLEVPFGDMVALSDAVLKKRATIRPGVRARRALERVILTKTFQSSRGVEEGMLLLGVRNAFAKISHEVTPHQQSADLKARLDRIVMRRNQVVHEGDLQRRSRPQVINRERVKVDSIRADIAWLRTLIMAIDKVLA